jgi:hypothetical protein
VPNIIEDSVLTLHSDLYKYKPSQKEEVLLAVMDAHLNKMNEKEQVLPDLRKKWVESAADILTGAPPHVPPFHEVNHKIPLIDKTKQYNYHLLGGVGHCCAWHVRVSSGLISSYVK